MMSINGFGRSVLSMLLLMLCFNCMLEQNDYISSDIYIYIYSIVDFSVLLYSIYSSSVSILA